MGHYSDDEIKDVRYAVEMAREHLRDTTDHHARHALEYLADAVSVLANHIESARQPKRQP